MCTTIQHFAMNGMANISVANPNLDGTGNISTVYMVPAQGTISGGTINSVTIKATGNTSEGMVRLFINNGVTTSLYKEISVPANIQTSVVNAFQYTLSDKIDLNPGYSLMASTQNSDNFNVIANGLNWVSCNCTANASACCADAQNIANTGLVMINTANSNLNGTGSISNFLTSGNPPLAGGTFVNTVTIKATGNTSEGMVRLFMFNGVRYFLLTEIPIPASVQTSVEPAYRTECFLYFFLQPGFSLAASTQNADTFNIITYAYDVINCPCLA